MTDTGQGLFGSFGDFVGSIFGGMGEDSLAAGTAVTTNVGAATSTSQGLFGELGNFVSNVFNSIAEWAGSLGSALSSAFSSAINAISGMFGGLGNTVQSIFSSIGSWASNLFSSLGSTFNSLVSSISSGLGKVGGWLGDIGKSITKVTGDLRTLLGNAGMGAGIGGIIGNLTGGSSTGGSIGGAIGGIAAGSSWFASTGLGQLLGSWAGPLGSIAGGLLGSVLGGLFGSKPSDKMMSATVSYRSGPITSLGGNLSDEKFSKENQDAAKQIANTIGTMARKLQNATGGYLTDGVAVEVGSRDGVKLLYGTGQQSVKYNSVESLLSAAWNHMLTKLVGDDKSKISTIKWATGGDAIFSKRTILEVGEAGLERVTAQKLGGSYGGRSGGGSVHMHFHGPVATSGLTMNQFSQDLVANVERETFRRRGRRAF
ncbi:hypothetical protein [Geminicoccus flavidas]|uniref:hypothetical protein n=1 Tax=Geminicoccus flavidas TaxID=2506407 RepID=UPI001357F059|nr:hypothetical protein [Geminicoccus flavidas]